MEEGEKRPKVIWEEPIQSQVRVLDIQDVTACLSLFKNFLVENLSKITFTSEMRGYRPGYHWYDPNTKEIVIGYSFKEDVIADFEGTKTAQISNLAHEFGHHIDFQISGLREKCNEIARKKKASCSRENFASLISWMVSGVKVYEYYKYSDLSILEEITSTIRDAAFIRARDDWVKELEWKEEGWLSKPKEVPQEVWDKWTPCVVCGRRGWDEWHAPDEEWLRYVPVKYQDEEVCQICFKRFRDEYERTASVSNPGAVIPYWVIPAAFTLILVGVSFAGWVATQLEGEA